MTCGRCDDERYIDQGREPCPRCNPGAVKIVLDDGFAFLVSGPVEVQVGNELFDVRLTGMHGGVYAGCPVVVLPPGEA